MCRDLRPPRWFFVALMAALAVLALRGVGEAIVWLVSQ